MNTESRSGQLHPNFQLFMLGFIFFMCPGMLYIFDGLGARTSIPPQIGLNALIAHFVSFSVSPVFSGIVVNALGPCRSLFLGGLGYPLYLLSHLIVRNHPEGYNLIVAGESIKGICAGILWTSLGSMMLAYPTKNRKGLVIGAFWALFYLGPLTSAELDLTATLNGSLFIVSNETYFGFIILTLVGASSALVMINPALIVRTDGTNIVDLRQPSWKMSLYSFRVAFKTDPMILFLFPMFFLSSYFHEWQRNTYNGVLFTKRTAGFNTVLYMVAQMTGSVFLGYCILDRSQFSRRTRALAGWAVVVVIVFIVHMCAYLIEGPLLENYYSFNLPKIDFRDPVYPFHAWFYIFCGLMDAMWNTMTYWLLGAISNDQSKLAVFVGFYRGLKTAGYVASGPVQAYSSFGEAVRISWILCVVGVVVAFPMIYYRVKESSGSDDLRFETELCMNCDSTKDTQLPFSSDKTK